MLQDVQDFYKSENVRSYPPQNKETPKQERREKKQETTAY